MADCAVSGAFRSFGKTLGTTVIGIVWPASLNPNFSACACRASAPRFRPSCANAVLHETRRASASVIGSLPHPSPPKLLMVAVVCGRSSASGAGRVESVVYCPLSRAAAAVISLNVDPGAYRSLIALLRSGLPGAASSAW